MTDETAVTASFTFTPDYDVVKSLDEDYADGATPILIPECWERTKAGYIIRMTDPETFKRLPLYQKWITVWRDYEDWYL